MTEIIENEVMLQVSWFSQVAVLTGLNQVIKNYMSWDLKKVAVGRINWRPH